MLNELDKAENCKFERASIPDIIEYTRKYNYVDSEFESLGNVISIHPRAMTDEIIEEISSSNHKLWSPLTTAIRKRFPRTVYFPTFLFAFPERILLNPDDGEEPVNAIYRKVIEDVAGALATPIDVQRHIVQRMQSSTGQTGAVTFPDSDKQQAVFSVLEQMSYHLSQTIFSEWQQILGKEYKKREVVLRPVVEKAGGKSNVYLQFSLREEGSIFAISERSLGFRWFFSFLLFTHYRARANLRGSTLFLLDEPASNLHPKAQMQLLASFAKIASPQNAIIYSTHSHYMINPNWLEQAFVVSNTAIDDTSDDLTESLVATPPHIRVERYRNFVGQNADKITYFQPVLDRLDFAPSHFDLTRPSILVEGKGDYIILEYIQRVYLNDKEPPYVVPTRGATAMGDIIGLFLGWGVPFCILLDDDKEGKDAKKAYISDWGLEERICLTYNDVHPNLKGMSIEGLIEKSDIEMIKNHFNIKKTPTKSQIRQFFSENLASNTKVELSEHAASNVKAVFLRARNALKLAENEVGDLI